MNNIIECKLESTYKEIFTGLWQHDYGQILRITGVEFPKAVEIQFSLNEKSGSTITRIGTTVDGVTEVQIPNELLKNDGRTYDYCIYAYIYLTDETSGSTEYEIVLRVKSRTKPENPSEEPLPEPNIFHETVAAVNASAERAEMAEQNANASATEAGKYASSASESAVAAEKTKEDALKEVGEKKREAIEAIQEQEETSVGKITTHTDVEIQRIQNQIAKSKGELEQTVANAGVSKEELDESIRTAGDTKKALDKSTELAGTAKTEMDASTQKAGEAKTALDGSAKTAGDMQETLNATVKQAGALDTSLSEKIKTGTQLKTDLVASGEKAVQDIQTAGSEQLDKMKAVAEEFTADREQINVNKEDISILKEEMSKNYLDDAKTKRSLDALWKLNQGISYQFEADAEKAYQKDIPSGAKLAIVKKIGGRTIVWNQLAAKQAESEHNYGLDFAWLDNGKIKISGTSAYAGGDPNVYTILKSIEVIGNHKYLFKLTGTDRFCILGYGIGDSTPQTQKLIFNALDSGIENLAIYGIKEKIQSGTVIDDIVCPQIYNLTKMFGAGNEPSTPEEFEALFLEDYYPYNEGELMSMPVNEVVEQGKNLLGGKAFADKIVELGGTLDETNGKVSIRASVVVDKTIFEFPDESKSYTIILYGENTNTDLQSANLKTDNRVLFNRFVDRCSITTVTGAKRILGSYDTKIAIYDYEKCGIFEGVLTTDDFKPYHKNTYPIPQAILDLDGYGDGVSSDVYNYVDWENKQYHKRVGKVDLGSLIYAPDGSSNMVWYTYGLPKGLTSANAISNKLTYDNCSDKTLWTEDSWYLSGSRYFEIYSKEASTALDISKKMQGTMLYYELAKEEIVDISDIIDSTFQEPIEVEAGGTLTFHNSNGDGYRLPIPNEEEYIVSLAEVGGGGASE